MSVYIWEEARTGVIVEVDRPIRDYQVEPDYEECVASGIMSEDDFRETQWLRLMRHPNDTKSHRTYIQPEGKGWDTPGRWSR